MLKESLIRLGPWLMLCAGYAALWVRTHSTLPTKILIAGSYIWATIQGLLTLYALIPLSLLITSTYLVKCCNHWQSKVGHVLFVGVAVGLTLHHIPGFNNIQAIPPAPITPDAVPFSLWLNFDKPLVGLWLLLFYPLCLDSFRRMRNTKLCTVIGIATIVLCLGAPFLAGYISWEPKWPHWGWLWVLKNLFIVSMTEEIFFRGYLQKSLETFCNPLKYGPYIALGVTSLLFGISHIAGGSTLVVFATCAGFGYGLAWHYGGLKPAILIHFTLNLVHFLFLTYPALA